MVDLLTDWTKAANNFPVGAGQIVWSNLFLLGHIPFLAGQTSITSYRYKSTPSPLHMMFKYETSKFSKHLLYMSIDLNAGKVERMVQQNQYHICAYYYCLSSTSYIRLVMKLMKLTEACNLVDFKCCQKQGSSFPKMRDWTFKIQWWKSSFRHPRTSSYRNAVWTYNKGTPRCTVDMLPV